MTFARLNYFHTMGPAVGIAMLFTIAAALTLGPAILTVGSLFGLFDPRSTARATLYRRIGASVVRWPVPILAASAAAVLFGRCSCRRTGKTTTTVPTSLMMPRQSGFRGRGPALPEEQTVLRDADGRDGSRHAKLR
ncbi:MMPL family protein [Mycobacterium xenopi 3993]|nr:MMPL family protein [Mycobacterium xenopi 3993]